MKALTNGLGVSEAADGVRAFVREYERHAFVGRRDELKQLDEWIAGEASTLLVVAPAGRGKSALLLHWAPRHPQIAWVPISVRYGTARSSVVRALLASRIAFLGGEQPGDWLDAARSSDVVVVLDGLDEAADGAIVDDLRGLADSEGVRIVVAARELVHRDAAGWARHLGWDDRALHIAPLNRAAIAELLGEQPVDVLNEVVRLSDGDPLTATLLAEHLAAGGELAMKEIEGGFDAVFEAWWQDMRSPALDAVVQTLARAASPVRPSLLARVADAPVETVADALEVVRRVVVTNAVGEVAFAHPRLGSYFTDRMSPDRAAEVDAAWAAATTTYVDQLANGKGLGSDAGYVLSCHCVHLERTGAPLEQYARLARRDWLEAWEAFEGGTTGFLEDMFSVWEIAERALAKEWSDAVTALQMKLSAACTLLTTTERNVSPRTRAEAVRLGVRSQRAAIASVVTIEDPYSLKVAVEALIEVLDDWGRQLLLATMDDPGRWPATAGAQLALEQELGDEAVQRLVAGDRPETRIERIVSAFDQHRAHAEALREVVRADLERLDYQEDPESALESAAAAVSIFDVEEGRTILGRAVERLDAIGDRDLYWDDHYGDTDPRFALSEAALKVNDRDLARAMLERARELPYPWSPETGPGPELVEAWSKYGPVPAEALDGLDEAQLVRAHLALLKGGLDYDRQLVVRALKVTDDATALRAAVASSDSSLQRLGAERLFEMLDACARKPDDYARGYPLYAGGMAGLAEAPELLKPKQIERAVKILWRFARNPPSPVSTWHVLHALVPALLRTSARLRDEIAQALLEYASENPRLEPPLCDVPGWEQLYDARAQASYVRGLLAHRDLDRADECIEALATLAGETMSEKVFATAIAVAKQFALGSLGVIARVAANEWEEIAELTTDAFEREEIGPWDVAAVVEQAPAPEQKAKLARRIWAARFEDIAGMGCAGDLLEALDEKKAEHFANRLVAEGRLESVQLRQLAPKARGRLLAEARSQVEAEGVVELATLYRKAWGCEEDAALDGVFDALRTWVDDHLADAPDESSEQQPSAKAWQVLERLAVQLGGDDLDRWRSQVQARAPSYVWSLWNYRYEELGRPDDADWTGRGSNALDRVRALLKSAKTPEDLRAAFVEDPDARCYPWVLELIAERGLAGEYAKLAVELQDPSDRLLVWRAGWDHISAAEREALWPRVAAAMDADRGGSRGARYQWLARLSRDELRRQWSLEMRHQRRTRSCEVVTGYAAPLGVAPSHAEAFAEVLRWFLP